MEQPLENLLVLVRLLDSVTAGSRSLLVYQMKVNLSTCFLFLHWLSTSHGLNTIACLPKAAAVMCFLSLIYRLHAEKKSSTNWHVECKHWTPESHTHTLLHLAEGCSWCGPISFGCCSQGKHTLLIRPTDDGWKGVEGEDRRKKKRKSCLMESLNHVSKSD